MPSVLVVEDDRRILIALQTIIEGAGHVVHIASNGRDALHVARTCRVDVVVSDLKMPEMDGVELCRQMACDPSLSNIPIILQSGVPTPPAEVKLAAFLLKPFSPAALLLLIELHTVQPLQP